MVPVKTSVWLAPRPVLGAPDAASEPTLSKTPGGTVRLSW